MKRFLVLALIYSLNILMFLFAKSAGADIRKEIKYCPKTSIDELKKCPSKRGRAPAVIGMRVQRQ